MSIYMLSDSAKPNPVLREHLTQEVAEMGGAIAYVSATQTPQSTPFFETTQQEYRALDPSFCTEYFDLTFPAAHLARMLDFGVVHLSGGNTFEFMAQVVNREFGDLLLHHLDRGGLLVGVSAGAILLTPRLETAHIAGDAHQDAKDMSGLGIVPFEFYPHYTGTQREDSQLNRYAKKLGAAVFACPDTEGLRVEHNKKVTTFGRVACFDGRSKTRASSLQSSMPPDY